MKRLSSAFILTEERLQTSRAIGMDAVLRASYSVCVCVCVYVSRFESAFAM